MTTHERIDLEAAYLLHAKPYRETSRIIEVLSQHRGRVALVARGALRPRSRWGSALQPFQPLRLSWSGRGGLQTLIGAEVTSRGHGLSGQALLAAYYLNELLLNLLHRSDPHPDLFAHYGAALAELAQAPDPEPALRRFELALLAEIGYGLVTDRDVVDGQPLRPDGVYRYVADRGPVPAAPGTAGRLVLCGADLIAIGQGRFDDETRLRAAKSLLRAKIDWCLGGQALKTRRVLASMRSHRAGSRKRV